MKIKKVIAFEFNDQLFKNKEEVSLYIEGQKENRKIADELKEQEKLKKPLQYKISDGYFDFLLCNSEMIWNEDFKYVKYKTKRFATAINRIMKRKSVCNGTHKLDYECHVLDKNGKRTDFIINLHDMPEKHNIHELIY